MNSLKRLYIGIKSHVDQIADVFKNHEALATIAIQDLQTIASKTRLHFHRINKMTGQYQRQLDCQKEQEALWTSRAIKAKKQDQQKALQCVKRLAHTKKRITLLERQHLESINQENKIRDDLNAILEQLQILNNKKDMLAVRQNRSHLQNTLQDSRSNPLDNIQKVFDRWEEQIASAEYDSPPKITDTLLNEFEQEEETAALQKMLDELTEPNNN